MPRSAPNETPEQREKRLARQRAYEARRRQSDPEGFRRTQAESSQRYRQARPENAKASNKKWRDENRGKVNSKRREWRCNNIVRALFLAARSRAKARGTEFTISLDDIPAMGATCPLLGHLFPENNETGTPFSPSLDRVDSSKGYVPGNVWIVGYRANLIKNDGTAEEHEMIARAMRERNR